MPGELNAKDVELDNHESKPIESSYLQINQHLYIIYKRFANSYSNFLGIDIS